MSNSRSQIRPFSALFYNFVKPNPADDFRDPDCFVNNCKLTKIISYKPNWNSIFKMKLKFNQIQFWFLLKFRFAVCNL